MEQLKGISIFVETVEAGGFSAAAERLHLTRSAVSKTIARLEERLGVRLFNRTTRAQSLTDEGRFFYERCLRAVEEIRIGEAQLESGKREVRGRLRVSMPALFGRHCAAPILTRLLDDHPDLELDLSFNDRVVDLLEDGFDLAVRNGPLKDNSDLMTRAIARQPMTVCASPAYLEKYGVPQTLDDIAHHQGIVYRRGDNDKAWTFPATAGPAREVLPKSRLRLDDLASIADAAVKGRGLAWLTCWLVRDRVLSGELVRVLTDRPPSVFEAYAVWPRSPVMLPKVRLAIDMLATDLPRLMG
ncbi:UNVERIFIED_ORG: DNA-binding transcriptional LysR family regulator [Rhizobium aethiopicum]|uniref:LysR family transcriptional regulator n=1 Tax=unclassified Rhizobium TaxID=2613769 RepID=UPI0007EC0F28|nr:MULTISPECIES: LysR family transcriptional regulator [unclassified Rhizobium]ANM11862.1 LysR family transcriptional regulator protein [Rhizobium sp. N324]ANM18354.1 LysR family transcriptional regulator protein [Rhizobium sp. N541]ANM24740.1 LysR family transcriptional regulator protein [Rhizobium sp. N941]OYD05467.1 LysR family transcriptional regulator protein [Rhizobium sp. N4311]